MKRYVQYIPLLYCICLIIALNLLRLYENLNRFTSHIFPSVQEGWVYVDLFFKHLLRAPCLDFMDTSLALFQL